MRGKFLITPAVVLSRRDYRENDLLVVLFCEEAGKLLVRFRGVKRSRAKLRALSEPMVLGEYRLYLPDASEIALGAGGMLIRSHPGLRRDLVGTLRGLEACELLERLTPWGKPAPEKFRLLSGCLETLESLRGKPDASAWVVSAYTLKLLALAGFGVRERRVSDEGRAAWELLHDASLEEVARLSGDPSRQGRLQAYLQRVVERLIEKPLRAAAVREQILSATK